MYSDWVTKTELLAGCMTVYDRRQSKPALLGVTCMDMNMVVDIPTLKKQDGFTAFRQQYEKDSRQCLSGRTAASAGAEVNEATCASSWSTAWDAVAVSAAASTGMAPLLFVPLFLFATLLSTA